MAEYLIEAALLLGCWAAATLLFMGLFWWMVSRYQRRTGRSYASDYEREAAALRAQVALTRDTIVAEVTPALIQLLTATDALVKRYNQRHDKDGE
jgi:hypothetical protein